MKRKPTPYVADDPAAYKDPKRHAFRTPSPGIALAMCSACGKFREEHHEANEDGTRRKVTA